MLFGLGGGGTKAELTDDEIATKYGLQIARFDAVEGGAVDDANAPYQLRRYRPMYVVECAYEKRPEGYTLLDGYTQHGENAAGLAMPRTAPCLMLPCASPKRMRYVLPSPHTPLEPGKEALAPPEPTCDLLTTFLVDAFTVAVARFSGYATPDVVFALRDATKERLAADGVSVPADVDERIVLAQYNELFSLPWKRDNELWLPVEG